MCWAGIRAHIDRLEETGELVGGAGHGEKASRKVDVRKHCEVLRAFVDDVNGDSMWLARWRMPPGGFLASHLSASTGGNEVRLCLYVA